MKPIAAVSWDAFMRIDAGRWNEQSQHQDNPFITLPWLQSWWEHFGNENGATILLERNDHDVPCQAFFTRHLRESYYGAPLRVIRGWANNHCARGGVLADNNPEEFASSIAEYWCNNYKQWDVLRLQGLPSAFSQMLTTHLQNHGMEVLNVREWGHHILPIDRPWNDYFSTLSSETRRVQGRLGRRLQEIGRCEWRRYENNEAIIGLEKFFDIDEHSWKAKTGEVIKQDSNLLGFYRSMMLRFSAEGKGQVDLLLLNDLPISGVLSIRHDRRLFTLKTSYREDFAKYSPGWQLFRHFIEKTFTEDLIAIDFCADLDFSARWTKQKTHFCDLVVFSQSPLGRLAGTGKKLFDRLRETVA